MVDSMLTQRTPLPSPNATGAAHPPSGAASARSRHRHPAARHPAHRAADRPTARSSVPTPPASYSVGVTGVLRSAALVWSGVMPVAQFIAYSDSVHSFDSAMLIRGLFVAHALCWVATLTTRSTMWAPVMTWSMICVGLAVSAEPTDVAALRIVLNVCLCVGIVAALVGAKRTALSVAGALSGAASVAIAVNYLALQGTPETGLGRVAQYYALAIPVYTVCSTAAVALLAAGWRDIAELTDRHRASREHSERAMVRGIAKAELGSHQSRVLHDTVVNTLGAVANGAVVSDREGLRERCRADVAAIDALEEFRIPGVATVSDLISYAGTLDIDLVVHDRAALDALIARQPLWRRQEIVGLLGESITNAAKHSQVDRVSVSVDGLAGQVAIRDEGVGTADTAALVAALDLRARDGMTLVDVESAPGAGMTVTLTVPPLQSVEGRNVLADAVAGITVRLVPVLLAEFLAVAALASAFRTGWSMHAMIPALVAWMIVAAVLVTLTVAPRRDGHLSALVVTAGYLGMVAAGVVAVAGPFIEATSSGNGFISSNMSWLGDAAAGVCICFILVDGRRAVVLPPLVIGAAGLTVTMMISGRAATSAVVTLFADALLIAVFMVVRTRMADMAAEIENLHRRELLRREELERSAVEASFHAVQGPSLLSSARALLTELIAAPERSAEYETRAAARHEESRLRALITIPVGQEPRWMPVIEMARSAGVLLTLHFFGGGGGGRQADEDVGDEVIGAVVDSVGAARAGERVTVGVFAEDSPVRVTVVADSLSGGIVELGGV